MGFNLPPGVNISDLPGNTPRDEAWERYVDDIYKAIEKQYGETTRRFWDEFLAALLTDSNTEIIESAAAVVGLPDFESFFNSEPPEPNYVELEDENYNDAT